MRPRRPLVIYIATLAVLLFCFTTASASETSNGATLDFPPDLESYGDAGRPVFERMLDARYSSVSACESKLILSISWAP
jgi:hypothetical protein